MQNRRSALLIVDQVSYSAFSEERRRLPLSALQAWHKVRLGYVPRTTPTGHATISTGLVPAEHMVQGRNWYARNGIGWASRSVDDIVSGCLPLSDLQFLRARSLTRLEREGYIERSWKRGKRFIRLTPAGKQLAETIHTLKAAVKKHGPILFEVRD